jgi:predicted deacylase
MACLPAPWSDYPDDVGLTAAWCQLADASGASTRVAGWSVEGRPIWRFDFGAKHGSGVLLTALIHGVELIGSVALLDFVRTLTTAEDDLLRHARLVVLPIVNPDGLHATTARLARRKRTFVRGNSRGVDLNRNFPRLGRPSLWNPLAGSRFRLSPYYAGPTPFSEPETRTVRDVAVAVRPCVSLGFHSSGEMLLYPWAFTREANPRKARYERAGAVFQRSLRDTSYSVMQATQLYSTVGDMDDWLDAELGTMAFTVEVSRPRPHRQGLRDVLNPFAWLNPRRTGPATTNLTPGLKALVHESCAACSAVDRAPADRSRNCCCVALQSR